MMNSFEQFLHGRLTLEQLAETSALEAKHLKENRELARKEKQLVSTPEEFNPDMIWEEGREFSGYRIVEGYTLEDIDKERPSQLFFWCDDCEGWVKGKPYAEHYDHIGPLSGSRGIKYNCSICDHEVADDIKEMS